MELDLRGNGAIVLSPYVPGWDAETRNRRHSAPLRVDCRPTARKLEL